MQKQKGLRRALPGEIPAGYWDQCPHCSQPLFLPVAGSKDSKAPVECPACGSSVRPEC